MAGERKFPWWLRWLEPNDRALSGRVLLRCDCGRLLWMNSSQRIMRLHDGHYMRIAMEGSAWEFLKLKLGWLDKLTVRERLQERGWL
jgi:hypothetical protein